MHHRPHFLRPYYSTQFAVALLLSVIIAIPMLLDVMMDTYYVFRKDSGRKLHWYTAILTLLTLTLCPYLHVLCYCFFWL